MNSVERITETAKVCDYVVSMCVMLGGGYKDRLDLQQESFYSVINVLLENGVEIKLSLPQKVVSKTFKSSWMEDLC